MQIPDAACSLKDSEKKPFLQEISLVVSGETEQHIMGKGNGDYNKYPFRVHTSSNTTEGTTTVTISNDYSGGSVLHVLNNYKNSANVIFAHISPERREACLSILLKLSNVIENYIYIENKLKTTDKSIKTVIQEIENEIPSNALSGLDKYFPVQSKGEDLLNLAEKNKVMFREATDLMQNAEFSSRIQDDLNQILAATQNTNKAIEELQTTLDEPSKKLLLAFKEKSRDLFTRNNINLTKNMWDFLESPIDIRNPLKIKFVIYLGIIFELLHNHQLLNQENVYALLNALSLDNFNEQLKKCGYFFSTLSFLDNINNKYPQVLRDFSLLTQSNFMAMVQKDAISNRSCDARVGGLGVDGNQEKWGYWCRGIEEWLPRQFLKGTSLSSLENRLCEIRSIIAREQGNDDYIDFGMRRSDQTLRTFQLSGMDFYTEQSGHSIVNIKYWPTIKDAATKLYKEYESRFKEVISLPLDRERLLSFNYKDNLIKMAEFSTKITEEFSIVQKVFISFDKNNEIKSALSYFPITESYKHIGELKINGLPSLR